MSKFTDYLQSKVTEHARDDLGARDNPSNAWPGVAEPPTPTLWDRVADHIIDRVVPEVGDMLDHKVAQGAAELSQALNSQSNAYVPYGVGQAPLEIEGPQTSYQNALREASHSAGHDQEQGLDR